MSRKLHRPILDTKGLVVPVTQGGSQADTLTQGAIELEMLTYDQIGDINSIPGLDADGHIAESMVPSSLVFESLHVSGPTKVATNSFNRLYITDYDQYKAYVISSSAGFIAQSDGMIYFKAPSTPGNVTITINGSDYTVVVDDKYILPPKIITPTDEYSQSGSTFLARSAAFEAVGLRSYKSLRFKGVNNYLYKTHSLINNAGTALTFSFWVKRSSLNTQQCLFGYSNGATASYVIQFDSSNRLDFSVYSGAYLARKITTQVITDLAWHHIVINHDTSKTNAADRVAVYVDNVLVQSFITSQDPTLNSIIGTGNYPYGIGIMGGTGGSLLNGYMSEINFIDGQALAPSSFGEQDADLGLWVPKIYTGSYGTNGFYLDFRDTSSLVDLGYDKSGQGNHWTPNNISLTAGITYDSMDDSPIANYAFLNANIFGSPVTAYQAGGLEGLLGDLSNGRVMLATVQKSTGKWYFEGTFKTTNANHHEFGITTQSAPPNNANLYVHNSGGFSATYGKNTASYSATLPLISTNGTVRLLPGEPLPQINDIVGVAYDLDNWIVDFYFNGSKKATVPLTPGTYYPAMAGAGVTLALNFGQRPFSYEPPMGYQRLYTPQRHTSTDWQLSDKADFSAITAQSSADVANKVSWPISNLTEDKDYFLRARYNSAQYGSSEWSGVRHFKTRASYLPTQEIGILTAYDKATNDYFGVRVALSGDGSRLAVGAHSKTVGGLTNAGKVYIYTRSGSTWALEAELSASDKATNDYFALGLSLSADGSRLAVGAHNKTVNGVVGAGKVYIYTRSGSIWTEEATITASDRVTNDYFGLSTSMNADGSRLAVGAQSKDVSGTVDAGQVYIYTRSGITWTLESTITASDKATSDYFGRSVALSADGSRLAVGAANKTISSAGSAGQVYIYTRSGITWTLESTITAYDKAANDYFGTTVSFNSDASMLIIGAQGKDVLGVADVGKLYSYIRTGITWILQAELSVSDKVAGDFLGVSSALTPDGSLLAVGAHAKTVTGIVNAGQIYFFA